MDYADMARRLEAVREEIRKNVPMLKLIDETVERMNRQFEDMVWAGSVNFRRR